MTLCFNTPFKTNKLLERSGNDVNTSMYESYLLGRYGAIQDFNNISYEEAVKLSKRDTRRYVKRQFTWFIKRFKTTVNND